MIGALRTEILDREIRRYCPQRQSIKASRDYVALRPYPTDGSDGRQQLKSRGDDRGRVDHLLGFLYACVASSVVSLTARTTIADFQRPFTSVTFAAARHCQPRPEPPAGERYEPSPPGYPP